MSKVTHYSKGLSVWDVEEFFWLDGISLLLTPSDMRYLPGSPPAEYRIEAQSFPSVVIRGGGIKNMALNKDLTEENTIEV